MIEIIDPEFKRGTTTQVGRIIVAKCLKIIYLKNLILAKTYEVKKMGLCLVTIDTRKIELRHVGYGVSRF